MTTLFDTGMLARCSGNAPEGFDTRPQPTFRNRLRELNQSKPTAALPAFDARPPKRPLGLGGTGGHSGDQTGVGSTEAQRQARFYGFGGWEQGKWVPFTRRKSVTSSMMTGWTAERLRLDPRAFDLSDAVSSICMDEGRFAQRMNGGRERVGSVRLLLHAHKRVV